MAGHQVWIPETQIRPGTDISAEIALAVKSADRCIIFLSRESVKSRWLNLEILWALAEYQERYQFKLIPALVDSRTPLPFQLANIAAFRFDRSKSTRYNIKNLINLSEVPRSSKDFSSEPARRRFLTLQRDALRAEKNQLTRRKILNERRYMWYSVALALATVAGTIVSLIAPWRANHRLDIGSVLLGVLLGAIIEAVITVVLPQLKALWQKMRTKRNRNAKTNKNKPRS